MKKLLSIMLSAALALTLSACGKGNDKNTEPKDYASSISDARSKEDNDTFEIISDKDSEMCASAFSMLGIDAQDVDKFAISCSFLNVHAYCVAIIMPSEGKAEAIKDALNSYVSLQKKNMENYLPEQYDIANNAVVKALKSKEIILVMSHDSAQLAPAIEKALK